MGADTQTTTDPASAAIGDGPAHARLQLITGGRSANAPSEPAAGPAALAGPVAATVETEPGPVAGVETVARQLDELAAMVEAELTREATAQARLQCLTTSGQLQELQAEQHGRRCTVLRLLAQALGEAHGDLDEHHYQLTVAAVTGDPAQETTDEQEGDAPGEGMQR